MRDQITRLLQLTNIEKIEVPAVARRQQILLIKLVGEAKANNATWPDIGEALTGDRNGKAAKAAFKRFAKHVNLNLMRSGGVI